MRGTCAVALGSAMLPVCILRDRTYAPIVNPLGPSTHVKGMRWTLRGTPSGAQYVCWRPTLAHHVERKHMAEPIDLTCLSRYHLPLTPNRHQWASCAQPHYTYHSLTIQSSKIRLIVPARAPPYSSHDLRADPNMTTTTVALARNLCINLFTLI